MWRDPWGFESPPEHHLKGRDESRGLFRLCVFVVVWEEGLGVGAHEPLLFINNMVVGCVKAGARGLLRAGVMGSFKGCLCTLLARGVAFVV